MKRFLHFIFLCVLTVAGVQATEYRMTVDNVENVEFDVNNTVVTPTTDGDYYKIDMGSERYLRVIAKQGILFKSVDIEDTYDNSTRSVLGAVDILNDGRYYIDLSSSFPEDEIFHIKTSAAGDARSASCTVNIDNPERAIVTRGGEKIELQAGSNTVKFNPETENEIEIEPVGKPLYRVSKGEEVFTTDYRYRILIADGDVVDIVAAYPDEDCFVTFHVEGYGAEDFITGVDVDGKPVFNWKDENFSVKCGSELAVYGNLNEYEVLSFMVNGETQMFTSKTTLLITESTSLSVSVQKYAVFAMIINIDSPEHIKVYRGHSNNNDEFTGLKTGDNVIEVTRNTPIVSLIPADGYYINTLSVNNDNYDVEDLQIIPVRIGQLTDNDVITVTTAKFLRDKKASIILSNLAAAEGYFAAKRADMSVIEGLHEGTNELLFDLRDNRFRFETGGPVEAHVFLNDVAMEPEPGGFNYCPTLADGDVLKIIFGEMDSIDEVSLVVRNEKPSVYDLLGRRVTSPARGIYIENGHKVLK